uniref:Uncharacterized protein n=1 Tax=Arundo donax TaxID=35708 RepID=A0A0A9CZI8_ARUDO
MECHGVKQRNVNESERRAAPEISNIRFCSCDCHVMEVHLQRLVVAIGGYLWNFCE